MPVKALVATFRCLWTFSGEVFHLGPWKPCFLAGKAALVLRARSRVEPLRWANCLERSSNRMNHVLSMAIQSHCLNLEDAGLTSTSCQAKMLWMLWAFKDCDGLTFSSCSPSFCSSLGSPRAVQIRLAKELSAGMVILQLLRVPSPHHCAAAPMGSHIRQKVRLSWTIC